MDDAAAGTGPTCLSGSHACGHCTAECVVTGKCVSRKPCFSAAVKGIFRLPGPPVGCWRAPVSPTGVKPRPKTGTCFTESPYRSGYGRGPSRPFF